MSEQPFTPGSFDWRSLYETAKSVTFEALPASDYEIEVVEAEATSSSNGKPMIKMKLSVTEGPHQNRKVLTQMVLSVENETALSIFFRQMKAFGITPEWIMENCPPGQVGPIAAAMLGRRAVATLGVKEWNGEPRNEVKSYKPSRYAQQVPSSGGMPVGPGMQTFPGGGFMPSGTMTPGASMAGAPQPSAPTMPGVPQNMPAAGPQVVQQVPQPIQPSAPTNEAAGPTTITPNLPI